MMNKKLFLESERYIVFIFCLAFFEKHVEEWIYQCNSGAINVDDSLDDFKKCLNSLENSFGSMLLSFNKDNQ